MLDIIQNMVEKTAGGRTLAEHLERARAIQDRWRKIHEDEVSRANVLKTETLEPLHRKSVLERVITIFHR